MAHLSGQAEFPDSFGLCCIDLLTLLTFYFKFLLNQKVFRSGVLLPLIAKTLFVTYVFEFVDLADVLKGHSLVVGLLFEAIDQIISLAVFKQRYICVWHCVCFRYCANTIL